MTKIVVVAGTHSGSGKTTISLALMSAFIRQGKVVQACKVGPDFIDPGHHTTITGRPSITLDGWMMGKTACRSSILHSLSSSPSPDILIIEGVMGLFDGASGDADTGSTAELAKWLDAPVLLVTDVRSMARSIAALVHGYTTLDKHLSFAGVICNRVGSDRHTEFIQEALSTYCPDILLLGCLPRNTSLSIPSRHLGLVTAEDAPLSEDTQKTLAQWLSSHLDLNALWQSLPDITIKGGTPALKASSKVCIGVARDEAFCFYYPDNLRLLKEAGATLHFFSPLHDTELPLGIDGIYLGGGYPEMHAKKLSENTEMRSAIKSFAHKGYPVYGECGGFMYLMEMLETEDGKQYPMSGCFAIQCTMGKRFRSLGYREVHTNTDSLLGPTGTVLRGHEFHYSFITQQDPKATPIYTMYNRKGIHGKIDQPEGFWRKNVLGTYVHAHFSSNPLAAQGFVTACATYKEK